jgi:hypothetical protein
VIDQAIGAVIEVQKAVGGLHVDHPHVAVPQYQQEVPTTCWSKSASSSRASSRRLSWTTSPRVVADAYSPG